MEKEDCEKKLIELYAKRRLEKRIKDVYYKYNK